MSLRRVVVTGLGCVCPLGSEVDTAWENVVNGQSGISLIDNFDCSTFPTKIAGLVKDFDPSLAMTSKETSRFDPFTQYAAEAARQAFVDSGLEIDEALSNRAGVAIGSGIGGMTFIETNQRKFIKGGVRRISPFFIPGLIANMANGFISMKHNLRGPSISIVTACATGNHNIGHAGRIIAYGDADVMLAGGAEKAATAMGVGGFNALKALSTRNDDPQAASRPWDKDRDGFVMADGAGVLVLEEYEHAKARGATIYAELVGFGMSSDAYHITAADPSGSGFVACMRNGLRDAKLNPEDIGYVNAHGTSTLLADPIEARAIKEVFANSVDSLLVSSTKSMTGHLLGAAGAVESIFSILSLRDQVAPPTINLDNPAEGCDLNFVPKVAQEKVMQAVLSNSFGFGGTNASLIFAKVE